MLVCTSVLVVVTSAVLVAVSVCVAVHTPGVTHDEDVTLQVLGATHVVCVGGKHVGWMAITHIDGNPHPGIGHVVG